MLKRFVGFALISALVGVAAAQDGAKAAPKIDDGLYPTAIGNKWVYAIVGKNKEMTVSIVRGEKVGDQDCLVLEASMEVTKDGKTAREVIATEHMAFVKGEYLRYKLGNGLVVPPLLFLKPAARKNESWTSIFELQVTSIDEKTKQPTVEKSKATTIYTANSEKVTVPAGTFDCTAVKAITSEDGKVTNSTVWFARGVGPVKQEFDFGDGNKFALELKSTAAGGK